MEKKPNILKTKSHDFARILRLSQYLQSKKKEYII